MQRIALLESEKNSSQAAGGPAASIALHTAVLAFAIMATSHAGGGGKRNEAIYIPLPRWRPEVLMVSQPVAKRAPSAAPRVPAISVTVPTVIPAPIPSAPISADAPASAATPSTAIVGSPAGSDASPVVRPDESPFAADEVDAAASALPGQRGPAYPEALRMMGVEGRVVARFVVGKNGRVESDVTIVSATDDQFVNAVKHYLAAARYRPATRNGEPVRQLAEQEFEFTVRR